MPRDSDQGIASEVNALTSPSYRHAFLQAIMQSSYLTETAAKQLFKSIFEEAATDQHYTYIVSELNNDLSHMQFQLRTIRYPETNERYIGFVNSQADEESKRAGKFKTKDGKPDTKLTAFFRSLMERILSQSDNTTITSISTRDAHSIPITIASAEPGGEDERVVVGAVAREDALDALVHDGWLASVGNDYTIGPRSYLELGQMMLDVASDDVKTTLEGIIG